GCCVRAAAARRPERRTKYTISTTTPTTTARQTATCTIAPVLLVTLMAIGGPLPALVVSPAAPGAVPDGPSSGLWATSGTDAVRAATGSTRPYPKLSSRPGVPRSFAVRINRLTTLAALSFGNFARTSAATPDTIAPEPLVPSPVEYPLVDLSAGAAPTMPPPAAAIPISGP